MLKHAIILPLKESFTIKKSGAVSIWVNDYLHKTKYKKEIITICSENAENNEKYLELLIQHNADVNMMSSFNDETPLYIASYMNNYNCLKIII